MRKCRMHSLLGLAVIPFLQVAAIEEGIGAQSTGSGGEAMRESLFEVQPAQERIAALRKVRTFYLFTAGDSQGTDRLDEGLQRAFGWSTTENLGEADVIVFFQSRTFLDDSLRSMRGNDIPTTDLGLYNVGPMPEHVQRKTVALITNQRTPKLLYLYKVYKRQGLWSPQDAIRDLKRFIGSPTD